MMSRLLPQLPILFLILQPGHAFNAYPSRKMHRAAATTLWSEPEYRSISDYMGGHHAGKFDFDTRISGVTALNYEKSLVFDNCAGSSGKKVLAPVDDEARGDLPEWATRDVNLESALPLVLTEQEQGGGYVGEVRIENDEISWEPFYAKIEGDDAASGVSVSPTCGKLAPRGGADNYSQSCILTIHAQELVEMQNLYIVVRTESDHWEWKT